MISNIKIRQIFLILIIAALGSLIFWQLKGYFSAFLGAYTLFILFQKWQVFLTEKKKWKPSIAALLLILFSMLVIILPLNGMIRILGDKVLPLVQNYPQVIASAEESFHNLEKTYHFEILTPDNIKNVGDWFVKQIQVMMGATFSGVLDIVVMFFLLFFMLTEHEKVEKGIFVLLPINKKNSSYIQKQINNLVFSNAVGIPLVAIVQGLSGLVIYLILGIPDAMLWFLVTCIAAVLPVLGAMLAYGPLAIILITQGNITQGVFLAIYGFTVIGSVDNIFRFWLQKKIGDTHPLITLFGVFLGLSLFGFMGLVFGPILLSLLVLFFQIYQLEYNHSKEELSNNDE